MQRLPQSKTSASLSLSQSPRGSGLSRPCTDVAKDRAASRMRFPPEVVAKFEAFFQRERKPSDSQKESLRQHTGLKSARQVDNWFRKRRVKAKRQQAQICSLDNSVGGSGGVANMCSCSSVYISPTDSTSNGSGRKADLPLVTSMVHTDQETLLQRSNPQYYPLSHPANTFTRASETNDVNAYANTSARPWLAQWDPALHQNAISAHHSLTLPPTSLSTEKAKTAIQDRSFGSSEAWPVGPPWFGQSNCQLHSNVGNCSCFSFS